jgi:hypothetical protein
LLDAHTLAYLEQVTFKFADLSGTTLGQVIGSTVTLDINAAGYGWFADVDGTPADGQVDLLTVVAHELGPWLGIAHDEADGDSPTLMSATLAAGARAIAGSHDGEVLTDVEVDVVAATEASLPGAGTIILTSAAEHAVPMVTQPLLSRETLQAPMVARQAREQLDNRLGAAPEELRVFDADTGELRPLTAEEGVAEEATEASVARETTADRAAAAGHFVYFDAQVAAERGPRASSNGGRAIGDLQGGQQTPSPAQQAAGEQNGRSRFAAPAFLTPLADAIGEDDGRTDGSYKAAAAAPGVIAAVLRIFERSRDAANQISTLDTKGRWDDADWRG